MSVYEGLRNQLISGTPAKFGIQPTEEFPRVWAALVDMGMEGGTATMVAVADGTTSMYTSGGGGMIGAGKYKVISDATKAFLAVVEKHLELVPVAESAPLPATNHVAFIVLTHDGAMHRIEIGIDRVGDPRNHLYPLWSSINGVISRLRLASEISAKNKAAGKDPGQGQGPLGS